MLKRQLIVSIPVKMDGGDVQVFEGYRVSTTSRAGQRKAVFVITQTLRSMR
jgi:glutamate dehydrogenase/leucine dehydrogenase